MTLSLQDVPHLMFYIPSMLERVSQSLKLVILVLNSLIIQIKMTLLVSVYFLFATQYWTFNKRNETTTMLYCKYVSSK